MNDNTIWKKIAVGLEWVDQNYDSLDEAGKRAFEEMYNGVINLVAKYGYAKGMNTVNAARQFVFGAIAAASAIAATKAIDKWLEWRESRLNKTETTDSE